MYYIEQVGDVTNRIMACTSIWYEDEVVTLRNLETGKIHNLYGRECKNLHIANSRLGKVYFVPDKEVTLINVVKYFVFNRAYEGEFDVVSYTASSMQEPVHNVLCISDVPHKLSRMTDELLLMDGTVTSGAGVLVSLLLEMECAIDLDNYNIFILEPAFSWANRVLLQVLDRAKLKQFIAKCQMLQRS